MTEYVPPFTDSVDVPAPEPVEPVPPFTESVESEVPIVDPVPPVFLPPAGEEPAPRKSAKSKPAADG